MKAWLIRLRDAYFIRRERIFRAGRLRFFRLIIAIYQLAKLADFHVLLILLFDLFLHLQVVIRDGFCLSFFVHDIPP